MDSYLQISAPSEGIYKEKRSKFLAFAYPILTEDEFKSYLSKLKKEFHDARHHCYAYKLGLTENNFRYSDDGEPNNSAGKPIYGQILSKNLTNVGIVVVRYFGGTKLGVGGLTTAYKKAAAEALNNAQIITQYVNNYYHINFNYALMSEVMNLIKKHHILIVKQTHEKQCSIEIKIRKNESDIIINNFEKIDRISITLLKTF